MALIAPTGADVYSRNVPDRTPVLRRTTPAIDQNMKSETMRVISGLSAGPVGEGQTLVDAFPGKQVLLRYDEEG